MSDTVCKIIPADPNTKISPDKMDAVKKYIEAILKCDSVNVQYSDNPKFIDCGSNLEKIKCPICGRELGFDWWQGAMSTASKSSFTGLDVVLPCCNKESSLNELDYDFKCGFASCEIDIVNPVKDIDGELIEAISKLLACDISVVIARY
jgi:hypothetical protein